jgi:hypothetical protein
MTDRRARMRNAKRVIVVAAAVAALAADVTSQTNCAGVFTASATCTQSRLHVDVQSTARLTVTGATFTGCRGFGQAAGCTATVTASNLPWVVTAPTTTNVSIDSFGLTVTVGTTGSTACFFNSEVVMTMTGPLSAGTWNQAQHQMTWTNTTGLTHAHSLGPFPSTFSAAYRDTTQTLSLVD